jgi:hypothetical protein
MPQLLLRDDVTPLDPRQALAAREHLLDVSHDLVREFEGRLAAGSVIRCVVHCRDELVRTGVRHGLVEAVHAMARTRLRLRVGDVSVPVLAAMAP